jgi:ABC-type phosphate transport system substrate-binding protein
MRVFIRIALFAIALGLSAQSRADIVVVVSAQSSITRLSNNQLADIFLGKVSRFPDGTLAVPIDLSEGSDVRNQFYANVADKTPAQIKAYWSKLIFTGRGQPPKSMQNAGDVKKYVAAHLDAIGYMDSKMLDDSVHVLR